MQDHILTQPEQAESSVASSTHLKESSKSSEEWAAIIRGWEQSGLSQKAYCEQHNVKFHNFAYHRKKHESERHSTRNFTQIKITDKPNIPKSFDAYYRLELPSGGTLSIPQQFESSSLKQLLILLGVIIC